MKPIIVLPKVMSAANKRTYKRNAVHYARSKRLAQMGFAAAAMIVAGLSAPPANAASLAQKFAASPTDTGVVVDHSAWDKLLKTYVVPTKVGGLNRIKYSALKAKDLGTLKSYIAMLEKVDPTKLGKNEQFAYWANLYNAKTVDVVLSKYPVNSIKKIRLGGSLFATITGGPWKAKIMKVNGTKLSLDDIEHGILRPNYKDPRVHYAVNCASVGCPNLKMEAYTGAKLQAQLDKNASDYINSPRGFKIKSGKVTASSLYKWYNKDFGGSEAGVIKHASKYASPTLLAKLKAARGISSYNYDWALNDAK